MRRRTAISSLVLSLVLTLTACGGDGGDVPPGDQDFTPEPTDDGTGTPPGATDVTCDAAADCGYWFCRCADGAVVNSALCTNGYCMDAATACPPACAYFEHGAWTGEASGGPDVDPPDPPACGGLGSSDADCAACFEDACCAEGDACGASPDCLDYWDCAVPCGGDPVCRDECDFLYPDGAAPYGALEACLVGSCAEVCGG